ncbi:hypothetical protein [Streptomyces sp. NPDC101234]|uniref:hypothetical protein n=1 Tax=Streptomyces sp. NPDC101234 TaxID=3366138 RepID=UPI003822506D
MHSSGDDQPAGEPNTPDEQAPLMSVAAGILFAALPATPEERLDAVEQLRAVGPRVNRELVSHSYLTGDDESLTAQELFLADENDGMAPEWEALRANYVSRAIVVSTVILLAAPSLGDRESDVALRVGFGLDTENTRIRDRLFGPLGRHMNLSLIEDLPHHEIGFGDAFRRTCLGGVLHALGSFGRAADGVPRQSSTAAIQSVFPARGCAGDWIDIRGSGFGSTQAAGLTLVFTAYAGGWVSAIVDPTHWSDTHIRVQAPTGVGNGPVGFLQDRPSGSSQTVAGAAEQLAGEALACLGRSAIGFAQKLRDLGPRLDAPHISATPETRFAGGPPKIFGFLGNCATRAMLRPRGPLTLSWTTDNADTVEIRPTGPPELPVPPTGLPTAGSHTFPSVATTRSWTGTYTLRATNPCGTVSRVIDVDSANAGRSSWLAAARKAPSRSAPSAVCTTSSATNRTCCVGHPWAA